MCCWLSCPVEMEHGLDRMDWMELQNGLCASLCASLCVAGAMPVQSELYGASRAYPQAPHDTRHTPDGTMLTHRRLVVAPFELGRQHALLHLGHCARDVRCLARQRA